MGSVVIVRAVAAVAVALAMLTAAAVARPADARAEGFLGRQSTRIVDGTGAPVSLRGVNFGNWLIWEYWIMGGTGNSTMGQTALLNKLSTLVGSARVAQFRSDVYANYITQADFDRVAQLGFNVVRVPFNHDILEDDSMPGVYKDSGWTILDHVMDWAEAAGVYVVLDMHAAPGGQNPHFIGDPDPAGSRLWDSPGNQLRTINLWKAIAERYKDRTTVAAWDLLNEPAPPSNMALTAFYQQLVPAVRSVDPNHMIMLEGTNFAKSNSLFATRYDANMALSIHQYLWGTLNAEGDLTSAVKDARRLDVPLWVGEMGEDTPKNIAGRVDRYNGDPYISGWADWTWKQALQSKPRYAPNQFVPTAAWQKTINWMAGTSSAKPTAAEAEQGLQDYITLITHPTPEPAVTGSLTCGLGTGKCIVGPTPPGTGTGLTGVYYSDPAFTTAKITRLDKTVNFSWGLGSPGSGIPVNNFSARWTGFVQPQFNDVYTFTVTVDDGVRLTVDGTVLIDDLTGVGKRTLTGRIALTTADQHPIKIEYREGTVNALIKLEWDSANQAKQVVPTTQLYP